MNNPKKLSPAEIAALPFFARKRALLARFKLPGAILYSLGCFRAHCDGDGFSGVWRWWHPVNWLLFPAVLLLCGFVGESIFQVMPFRLTPFWRKPENRAQLQWV